MTIRDDHITADQTSDVNMDDHQMHAPMHHPTAPEHIP
jgi:hypothetical protein